jgi:ketosteroid isomerase-like protein
MMDANTELLREVFRAVQERDGAALVGLYDPAVEFQEAPTLPYGGTHRGFDAVIAQHLAYLRAWDGLQTPSERNLDPRVVAASGDEVVVLWRQKGVDSGGTRLDSPVLGLYSIRDGKLTRAQMFHFDAAAVASFLENASRADDD